MRRKCMRPYDPGFIKRQRCLEIFPIHRYSVLNRDNNLMPVVKVFEHEVRLVVMIIVGLKDAVSGHGKLPRLTKSCCFGSSHSCFLPWPPVDKRNLAPNEDADILLDVEGAGGPVLANLRLSR
jgi:hypothetical protein